MNKKRTNFSNFRNVLLLLVVSALFYPAKAYAGPGAAIGAVIIFLTIIAAFLGSSIISIFRILSKPFKMLFKRKKSLNNNSKSSSKNDKKLGN